METYCSCGIWHNFDEEEDAKKFEFGEIPEAILCDECPICEPDTFFLGRESILLENYKEDDEKDEFYYLLMESIGDSDVELDTENDIMGDINDLMDDYDEEDSEEEEEK